MLSWALLSFVSGSLGILHYIAVIAVGFTIWYLNRRRNFGVWEAKGFPSIKPNILFGNMTDMYTGKENFITIFKTMYDDFKGHKIAVIYNGSEPQLLIRDPDLIKTIAITDFDHFTDPGWFPDCLSNIPQNDLGLLSSQGEEWRKLKAMMTPLFNPKALKKSR